MLQRIGKWSFICQKLRNNETHPLSKEGKLYCQALD